MASEEHISVLLPPSTLYDFCGTNAFFSGHPFGPYARPPFSPTLPMILLVSLERLPLHVGHVTWLECETVTYTCTLFWGAVAYTDTGTAPRGLFDAFHDVFQGCHGSLSAYGYVVCGMGI